jgi:hypothetical protein
MHVDLGSYPLFPLSVLFAVCNVIHNVKDLISALKEFSNWKDLGSQLDMSGEHLDSIETEHQDVELRKRAMLRAWFDSRPGRACWHKILNALIIMKQTKLAKKIAKTNGVFWVDEEDHDTLR